MNDFKFAFRQLLKKPGFAAVEVLTVALEVGWHAPQLSHLASDGKKNQHA